MTLVTIYHPGLDRETEVPAASVQHWRLAGWQEGPRPSEPESAEQAQEPDPAPPGSEKPADTPDPITPKPRSRRATAETEES
jgi:hypothetical protein